MKIVILDGYTVNPGDLSWDAFKYYGSLTVYDRTPLNEIIPRAKDAEVVITNKCVFSKEIIDQLPKLKHILILATGTNIIDHDAAKAHNITINNVPNYSTQLVAQHAFALLFEITRRAGLHTQSVIKGEWSTSCDFSYHLSPLLDLSNKKMGIIGFGDIGQAVARIAQAMDMEVLTVEGRGKSHQLKMIRTVSLETLLQQADVITLHTPLTPETEKMINQKTLSLMKSSAILLNLARGALIDETALAMALNEGKIYAAGLDVLSTEPPKADNPLLSAKNCIITPHIAWSSFETRQKIIDVTLENLKLCV